MSGSNSSAPGPSSAEPLSFTVHSMPQPGLDETQRRAAVGRWKMLLILLVCAAPVIASYFTYFVVRPQARTNYSELVAPARPIPDSLPLVDLAGQPVAPETLKGQWLLVVVGPAACDSDCEKALYVQRQLREMTGRERARIDKLWLVTDDASVRAPLREALEASPATRVLRVPHAALSRWLAPAAGESLERHMYIVDPMGGWMMRAPVDPDPVKLKRDIDKLLRASGSWDRAGR
jgi:hypothetical protein